MSARTSKVIAQVKESFLTLCEQYAAQGKLAESLAHHIKEDAPDGYSVVVVQAQITQHHEIGEQLKTLGTVIDLLGGQSVMTGEPAVKVVSGTRKELKRMGVDVPKQKQVWDGNAHLFGNTGGGPQ